MLLKFKDILLSKLFRGSLRYIVRLQQYFCLGAFQPRIPKYKHLTI